MRAAIRVILIIAGLFLPIFVASAPPPVAAATPDVTIWKTVDLATANPGDILTYTIYVNNLGPDTAPRIYVNDTLPTGTTYRGSTVVADIGAPPFYNESALGNTVRWQFRSYPAGNASFRVFAQVESSVSDGDVLRNVAALWYTNATGVPQPVRSASATTIVSVPVVSVTKTGTFTAFDLITYTITVSNTGTGSAASLWMNDTLPAGIEYQQARPVSEITCAAVGQRVSCTPKNAVLPFVPGSKVWQIDARIPSPLSPGTTITNWVFVNYTDSDGTYLAEARASAALTIQSADIRVVKIASATVVPPGGTILYTIFCTNSGQMPAKDVWVNDTLPLYQSFPAVTVIAANPALTLNTTTVVRWLLSNVAPGNHSVTLLVRTLASLGDGTRLVNSVTLNYTNADGLGRPGSVDSATTTISLNVPAIDAEFVARSAQVEPGREISYTLYYNNSRSALAAFVVAEVFFSPSVPLSSANPLYTSTGPGKYIWNLTDVGSGEHRITLTVSVPSSTAEGTVVRATAFVNYTDDRGNHIGGSQTSADVTVMVPRPDSLPLYLAIAIGVIVAVVVAVVVVQRRIAAAGETVIDEVFLLHRDGLLIKHYTRRLKPDVDSDVLSGMLIAVQNFVNESFIGDAGLKKEGQLDEMKFGQYRILLCRGKSVIVAAVISGPQVDRVTGQIRVAIDDLEGSLGTVLETWEGDMEAVSAADRYMQDLIAGKYRARMKLPRANH